MCSLVALLAVNAGCVGPEKGAAVYHVRGKVQRLPDPGAASRDLWLAHEAIDAWRNREGEVVGMDPMPMPFTLKDGVSLAGIEVGDVVEFQLTVNWDAREPVLITNIQELPPDTELVFRAAKPPQSS